MEPVGAGLARGVVGTDLHRWPVGPGQGDRAALADCAAPALLGPQAAQPGKQTQSFAGRWPGGSQTHLSKRASPGSGGTLSSVEEKVARRSAQSGAMPGG